MKSVAWFGDTYQNCTLYKECDAQNSSASCKALNCSAAVGSATQRPSPSAKASVSVCCTRIFMAWAHPRTVLDYLITAPKAVPARAHLDIVKAGKAPYTRYGEINPK